MLTVTVPWWATRCKGYGTQPSATTSAPRPTRASRPALAACTPAASTLVPGFDAESLGLKLAGKEMLKGGVEQVTLQAAQAGKLVLQGGVRLNSDEAKIAALYAERGHTVVAKPATTLGKSADFSIDGKPTELKTISHVKPSSAGEAISNTIQKASKQAKHIIIDARKQRGLSETNARNAIHNAIDEGPRSRISQVHLLGRDRNRLYELTVKK